MVTVVGPLIDGPVYLSVSAIAPPVHPGPGGATAATHAVFSTASLQMGTSQVSFAFALSFFALPCPSCEPLMSHVTVAVLQESFVRSFAVPVAVAMLPCPRLAIVLGLTVTALLVPVGSPLAGHAAAVKFVSVKAQFSRSAVPVFCTVIVIALLPLVASVVAQSFVTTSPGVWQSKLALSFAVATKFAFLSAVQKQLTVAVSGSLASSVSLHVVLIGTGVDVPPTTTMSAMGTAVLLITVLLSVAVQLKSAVPPVFWMTYCTVSVSAGVFVPFTVKAFQPRHDAVPSSLLLTKPTSMNGPAPHLICLSICTLQVSHVSCAFAVSVFWCPGLLGSTDPLISHVTETVLQESFVSPATVPVTVVMLPCPRLAIVLGLTATALLVPDGVPPAGHAASVKFVSVTVQFSRSAVPALFTVIVTALLPLVSRIAQSFVTTRPGV